MECQDSDFKWGVGRFASELQFTKCICGGISYTNSYMPLGEGRHLYIEKYSNSLLSLLFQLSINVLGMSRRHAHTHTHTCWHVIRAREVGEIVPGTPALTCPCWIPAWIGRHQCLYLGCQLPPCCPGNRGKEKRNSFSVRIIISSSTAQWKCS